MLFKRVEWSEVKRKSNQRKHNLDFVDARRVLEGPVISFEDDRFDYNEDRYISIGMLNGVVVVIAHTERRSGSNHFNEKGDNQ